jgi:aminocarboxymuconate-semialdehyde decarboxylase
MVRRTHGSFSGGCGIPSVNRWKKAKFMASIINEGILESYPGLKLVMAHGGGYFPHNMGRLDRNVKNAPHSMKNITRKPSEYLKNV